MPDLDPLVPAFIAFMLLQNVDRGLYYRLKAGFWVIFGFIFAQEVPFFAQDDSVQTRKGREDTDSILDEVRV